MNSVFKISALLSGLIAWTATASAQDVPDALTLDDALALVLAHSPRLEAFDWERRAADARIVQAGLRPNPELQLEFEDVRLDSGPALRRRSSSIGAAVNPGSFALPVGGGNTVNIPTRPLASSSSIALERETGARSGFREADITLSLSHTIEIGGKRAKRLRLARHERDLAAWDYEAARADVVAETVAAFLSVLAAQERLHLATELMDASAETKDAIAIRVDAGKVSPLELNKASIALAIERITARDAEHSLAAARARLAGTWGARGPTFTRTVGILGDVYVVPDLAPLLDAIESNPDIARWADEIAAREAQVDLARAKRFGDPTVWLGVSSAGLPERDATALTFNRGNGVNLTRSAADFADSREERLEIGVRWPLPIFNRNQGAAEEARHLVSKAAAERRAAAADLQIRLSQAHAALASASDRSTALQQDVLPQAEETHAKTLRGYEAGKFDLLDVLDAQRALFRARTDYLDAVSTFHQIAVRVERLSGVAIGPRQGAQENESS